MPTPPADAPGERSRPASADQLARQLGRKSVTWSVVTIWLLIMVRLTPVAGHLSRVTDDSASAYLPSSAPSTRVVTLQTEAQGGPGQPQTDQAVVVFARSGGLTAADVSAVATARSAVAGLVRHVTGLSVPGPLQPSADGRAAAFTANVAAPRQGLTSADSSAVSAIRGAVQTSVRSAADGLQGHVTGSAAVTADSGVKTSNHTKLLLTALVIIAFILLIGARPRQPAHHRRACLVAVTTRATPQCTPPQPPRRRAANTGHRPGTSLTGIRERGRAGRRSRRPGRGRGRRSSAACG